MLRFLLSLVICTRAQFDINQILYDSVKGTLDNVVPDNSPLQVKLDQLNDTLVLVYIETDIIPLLTEISRGDVIKSKVIADTIISENLLTAFNLSDNVLTLSNPLAQMIDDFRVLYQQSPEPNANAAQVQREITMQVLDTLDQFFESTIDVFGDNPSKLSSLLYSHIGLGFLIFELSQESIAIEDIDIDQFFLLFTEAMQVYLPNFQGTQWMEYLSNDFLPIIAEFSSDNSVDDVFENLGDLVSLDLVEALNVSLSSTQRMTIREQIQNMPNTLGYHFVVNVFCLTEKYNLCMAPDYMSYFLNQLDTFLNHLTRAYYEINVNFLASQSNEKLNDDLLRTHSWASAMLLEPSQYRTNRINTLINQENYLATVFPGQYKDYQVLMLQLVDPALAVTDQISIWAEFMNVNLELGSTDLNQTEIMLIDINSTVSNDTLLGDDFGSYLYAAVDLRDALLRVDDKESEGRILQNHLVVVSRAFENFLQTELIWFQTSGRRLDLSGSVSSALRVWSLGNQAAQMALVVISDVEGVELPEMYNLAAIIDMILSENLRGDYSVPADALARFYRTIRNDILAIQAVFLNFEVDELKKILEYSTDMILDLNEFFTTFDAEYSSYYQDSFALFDAIYAVTSQVGNGSLWLLLASKLHDLADASISVYEIIIELRV